LFLGEILEKASLSIDKQVRLLVDRGLNLKDSDENQLRRFLFDVNYFRASGYWRYFQRAPHLGDNRFQDETFFDQINDVYRFDFALRNQLLHGIAITEIALRSRMAHLIAQEGNARAYLDADFYKESQYREKLIRDVRADIVRSKEPYVKKYIGKSETVPIWAAIEVMSFGTVSKIYDLLSSDNVKFSISKSFGLGTPDIATSIFRSISTLRNICAHQGRIWNRSPIINPPTVPKALLIESDKSIYGRTPWAWIVTLGYVVDEINRNNLYSTELMEFVASYPEFIDGLKHPRRI